ncbi:MAG: hypothetical protein WC962_06320, partial [Phycisphaerae bacterium]|jgi:hypothetical protein
VKPVSETEMRKDRNLGATGTTKLCEVVFLQPWDGFRPGDKAITYLVDANNLKRHNVKVTMRVLPVTEAAQPTYAFYVYGDCGHFKSAHLGDPPAGEMCRPPSDEVVTEPAVRIPGLAEAPLWGQPPPAGTMKPSHKGMIPNGTRTLIGIERR